MTETAAYKVLTADQMAALERDGRFDGSPDDLRDGFVHLSTLAQLPGTLERHFAGATDLFLAEVDAAAAGPALRWEDARGGDRFPHLYGPLERDADGTARPPVAG